jgi:uroporphyrinogen-III decarboxylase
MFNWGNWVYYNNVTKTGMLVRVDLAEYVRKFNSPENLDALVDQLIDRLINIPINSATRARIIDRVLQGNTNPNYWTGAWYAFVGNPTADNRQVIQNRLAQAMGFIFQLGETHLH